MNEVILENAFVKFRINTSDGLLSLYDKAEQKWIFTNSYSQVEINGKEYKLKNYHLKNTDLPEYKKGRNLVLLSQPAFSPFLCELIIKLSVENKGIFLQLKVKNVSAKECSVGKFTVLTLYGKPCINRTFLNSPLDSWSFYKEGWGVVSRTGSLRYNDTELPSRPTYLDWHHSDAKSLILHKKGYFQAEYIGVLHNIETKKSLLLGFVTLADQYSRIIVSMNKKTGLRLTILSDGEEIKLIPGAEVYSEELFCFYNNQSDGGLEIYAQETAKRMKPCPWKSKPTGWSSWRPFGHNVTEKDIFNQVKFFSIHRNEFPIEYIQIDDGYQPYWGDWLRPNRKQFPRGMKYVIKKIRENNFKAGIWIAPVCVDKNSPLAKRHPDWFIMDKNGKPIIMSGYEKMQIYVLDPSLRPVREHIRRVLKKMVLDWGVEFFKLDFLVYVDVAIALGGVFQNRKMTRVQAVRLVIKTIRDAIGPEKLILLGTSSISAGLGLVNVSRISTDIGVVWRNPHWEKKYNEETGVLACARNVINRCYFHNRFWINDPDTIQLSNETLRGSSPETCITPEENKLWITMVGLTNGSVMLSEQMENVFPERYELFQKVFPLSGYKAKPFVIDRFRRSRPELWLLDINHHHEKWKILGVFNFEDRAKTHIITFEDMSLEKGCYHMCEFWSEKYLGKITNKIVVRDIPPHRCQLLVIKKVESNPQILSTSFHITQGTEIRKISHNKSKKTFNVWFSIRGHRTGRVVFSLPEGHFPLKCILNEKVVIKDFKKMAKGIYRISFEMDNNVKMKLIYDMHKKGG